MSKIHLLHQIINDLKNTDNQEIKLEILDKYKNEQLIKRIIQISYNPWINLGLQDFKPTHTGKKFGMGISRFLHIVDDLIDGKLDDKEAKFAVNMAFIHIDDRDAEVFLAVLQQSLDLGLEIDTINKVWPMLIMSYPIRTATFGDITDYDIWPSAVQPISVGLRVNIIINDGKVEYRRKDGTILDWSHWDNQFLALSQGQGIVFDGHAVVAPNNKIESTDNEQVLNANEADIRFIFWDAIRFEGWKTGSDTRIGYNWRYNGIEHMILLALDKVENPCYDVLKAEMIGSKEQLQSYASQNKQFVIKDMSGTWSHGDTDQELIIVS